MTKEVRAAGISSQDEEFMGSFSDTMTSSENINNTDFVPKSEDIQKSLDKAKNINQEIFKQIHPYEFRKQQEELKKRAEEEKKYKEVVSERMVGLKDEVNETIHEFLATAEDLRNKTEQRKQQLTKIKDQYNHLIEKKK